MAVLPIRMYGDPVLREKAAPYDDVDEAVRKLAADMGETMYAANGLGLAGNQIGVARRILVIDVTQAEEKGKRAASQDRQLEVYLNAEIVSSGEEDGPYNEGCLSIPGVEGDVYRPLRIRVKWMDLEGNAHEEDVDGLRARVLQHEIDHLDGVLFVDHLGMIKRKLLAGRLNALRRETLKSLGLAETAG